MRSRYKKCRLEFISSLHPLVEIPPRGGRKSSGNIAAPQRRISRMDQRPGRNFLHPRCLLNGCAVKNGGERFRELSSLVCSYYPAPHDNTPLPQPDGGVFHWVWKESYAPFLEKNSDMVMPSPSQIRSIVSTDSWPAAAFAVFKSRMGHITNL